jgi:hypothetical protein
VRALGPLITSLKSSNSQFEKGALAKIVKASDIKEKNNILKFLESDDLGMVRMGASMLKGILEK